MQNEYYVLVRPTGNRADRQPQFTADSIHADANAAIVRTMKIEKAAPYTDTSIVHVAALTDAKRALYNEQLRVKNALPERVVILKTRRPYG